MKILIRGTYFDDTLLSTLLSTGLPYHLKKFLFMPRSTCYFLREYNQTIMLLKMWHILNIFSAAMCSNIWKFWFHKIYIIYIQGEKTYWIDWWSYLNSVNHCLLLHWILWNGIFYMTERPWPQMSSLDLLRVTTRATFDSCQLFILRLNVCWLYGYTIWKWILTIQLLTWFLSQGCKELSCLFMDFSLWPLILSCKWSW